MEDLINNWDNILIDVKKYNIKINALLKKAKVSDSKFEKKINFLFSLNQNGIKNNLMNMKMKLKKYYLI